MDKEVFIPSAPNNGTLTRIAGKARVGVFGLALGASALGCSATVPKASAPSPVTVQIPPVNEESGPLLKPVDSKSKNTFLEHGINKEVYICLRDLGITFDDSSSQFKMDTSKLHRLEVFGISLEPFRYGKTTIELNVGKLDEVSLGNKTLIEIRFGRQPGNDRVFIYLRDRKTNRHEVYKFSQMPPKKYADVSDVKWTTIHSSSSEWGKVDLSEPGSK